MPLPLLLVCTLTFARQIAVADERAKTVRPIAIDRVVAIVGEDPVFESEARGMGNVPPGLSPREEAALVRARTDELVEERLMVHAAEHERIEVSKEDVSQAIDSVAKAMKTTTEGLEAAALKAGFTASEYRASVRNMLLATKWLYRNVEALRHMDPSNPEATNAVLEKNKKPLVDKLRTHESVEVR